MGQTSSTLMPYWPKSESSVPEPMLPSGYCSFTIKSQSGEFSSSDSIYSTLQNSDGCFWHLHVENFDDKLYNYQIVFEEFRLYSHDVIYVYDGTSASSRLLYQPFYGGNNVRTEMFSTGNNVLIKYVSSLNRWANFTIKYSILSK